LERMVETSAGSGRQGEFGVGTNRGINRFTRNIIFDEKRADTLRSAVGFAYEACGRLNRSATHRYIIERMNPSEIVTDGRTIQKDEKFS
jgi:aminopeptidase